MVAETVAEASQKAGKSFQDTPGFLGRLFLPLSSRLMIADFLCYITVLREIGNRNRTCAKSSSIVGEASSLFGRSLHFCGFTDQETGRRHTDACDFTK